MIKSVPIDRLDNYPFLKQNVICHFKGTEESASNDLRQLYFRPTQAFCEYVAEVKSSLEALLKVTKVGTNQKRLRDTTIRHKVLSTVPVKMVDFLFQEKAESLFYFQEDRRRICLNT